MKLSFQPELIKCHRWGGAASGELRPDMQAEIIGKPIHGAWLTAYMIRRFGPPNAGSDDHKNLCSWTITTPMKDLALLITPYLGSPYAGKTGDENNQMCLHFGYRYSDKLAKEIHRAEMKHRGIDKFMDRVWQWTKRQRLGATQIKYTNGREVLWTYPEEYWHDKDEKPLPPEDRYIICKPLAKEPDRKIYITRKEFDKIWWVSDALKQLYCKRYPHKPKPMPPYNGVRPTWSTSALVRQCNLALRASIRSLHQPIFVRDVCFGVAEKIADENIPSQVAEPYKYAGYPCKLAVTPAEDA